MFLQLKTCTCTWFAVYLLVLRQPTVATKIIIYNINLILKLMCRHTMISMLGFSLIVARTGHTIWEPREHLAAVRESAECTAEPPDHSHCWCSRCSVRIGPWSS